MKLEWRTVPRKPSWPLWAVGLVVLWTALVASAVILSARGGSEVSLCAFKRITGVPCPTCGGTRGVLALLHGRVLRGFLYNPLLFTVIILFLLNALSRILFGKAVRVRLNPSERRAVWVVIVAAVLANWAYVIAYVG